MAFFSQFAFVNILCFLTFPQKESLKMNVWKDLLTQLGYLVELLLQSLSKIKYISRKFSSIERHAVSYLIHEDSSNRTVPSSPLPSTKVVISLLVRSPVENLWSLRYVNKRHRRSVTSADRRVYLRPLFCNWRRFI